MKMIGSIYRANTLNNNEQLQVFYMNYSFAFTTLKVGRVTTKEFMSFVLTSLEIHPEF